MFNGVIDEVRRYKKQRRTGTQKLVSLLVAPKGTTIASNSYIHTHTYFDTCVYAHSYLYSPSLEGKYSEHGLAEFVCGTES